MTIRGIVFIVLVFGTFVSNGVQAYIHFEAYPLIPFVGKSEFAAYIKEYEKRLTIPLLLPYGLTVLSNLALIVRHQNALSVIWLIVALVLNIAVSAVTLLLATPVYARIKESGQASGADWAKLMQFNLLRLLLSTASSAVVIIMMLSLVSG